MAADRRTASITGSEIYPIRPVAAKNRKLDVGAEKARP